AADPAYGLGPALHGRVRRSLFRRKDLLGARAAWSALSVSAVPLRRCAAAGADRSQLSGADPNRRGERAGYALHGAARCRYARHYRLRLSSAKPAIGDAGGEGVP